MKRKLKLLSGILMASILTNNALIQREDVNARPSRTVVVNSDANSLPKQTKSSEKATDKTNKTDKTTAEDKTTTNTTTEKENTTEETTDDTTTNKGETTDETTDTTTEETTDETTSDDTTTDDSTTDETTEEGGTTNILEMLNSDKKITKDQILELSKPVSYSFAFMEEFNTTFPKMDPLREVSPILKNSKTYLDVNAKELKSVTKFLNGDSNGSSYYEQNTSNMLLNEISDVLSKMDKDLEKEMPSTIFSLMPTLTVFNDTYKFLSEEYNSIIASNSKNPITLNMLLENVKGKLLSLLTSINEFKTQLPDLIKELNKLVSSSGTSTGATSTTNKKPVTETTDDTTTEGDETTDTTDGETTDETTDETADETTTEVTTEGEEVTEDTTQNTLTEEDTTEEEVVEDNTGEETTTASESEEETDPTKEMLYFGDSGQELTYDEEKQKYYQPNPENPESDELVEYTGNVTKMTLAEYLDTDVYFDEQGNELIYDKDANGYFSYNSEKDEFEVYSGKVIKKKMKEVLESEK